MGDFIMDAKIGATTFTIGTVKDTSVIFPSSSIVAARQPSQTPHG